MEILHEFIVLTIPDWIFFIPAIILLNCTILILFADKHKITRTIFLIFLALSSIGALFYGITIGRIKETIYEVSFHEPIDMNEFLDKYEIVEVHGHIVKIKDKGESH